jgi:hypothetical protein
MLNRVQSELSVSCPSPSSSLIGTGEGLEMQQPVQMAVVVLNKIKPTNMLRYAHRVGVPRIEGTRDLGAVHGRVEGGQVGIEGALLCGVGLMVSVLVVVMLGGEVLL